MGRSNNSRLESGIVMTFRIEKFKKLKATNTHKYRGRVDLYVCYEIPGMVGNIEKLFSGVVLSSLAAYNLISRKEEYLGKVFMSLNTSDNYQENPFMLVKSGGKHFMYMVHENGHYIVDVVLPGGVIAPTIKYKYKKAVDYVRYLDADALRKPKVEVEPEDVPSARNNVSDSSNIHFTINKEYLDRKRYLESQGLFLVTGIWFKDKTEIINDRFVNEANQSEWNDFKVSKFNL